KITDNIHQLVFYSPSSKYKIISNNASNNLLRKTLKKLDIQPITMHGLRHTHASVLLYKKVSIYYVSERLGHKDIETTLNNYSHVIKELRTKDEKASVEVYENMVSLWYLMCKICVKYFIITSHLSLFFYIVAHRKRTNKH